MLLDTTKTSRLIARYHEMFLKAETSKDGGRSEAYSRIECLLKDCQTQGIYDFDAFAEMIEKYAKHYMNIYAMFEKKNNRWSRASIILRNNLNIIRKEIEDEQYERSLCK